MYPCLYMNVRNLWARIGKVEYLCEPENGGTMENLQEIIKVTIELSQLHIPKEEIV